MIQWVLKKLFGTKNERELKRIAPLLSQINALEENCRSLTDSGLGAKTPEFKGRIENGASLENLLPEAFACVREAARRTLGMRHFDVQLLGGIVLHEGKIAEMKTGEGKTLVATLPVYLNALMGKGVHVVTVNDYLARRDSEWMGVIYKFLGLHVGVILHGLTDAERQWAYRADVTYGTNNEFGFDHLRDNMKFDPSQFVQRPLHYGIVDEVDSILVDEARTPLIISGPAEESTELYYTIDQIAPHLKRERHFTVDEKSRAVVLTEEGVGLVESKLKVENLYDPKHIDLLHHVNQALRAHVLYKRDVDYVVKEGQVMIVDEFTGRLMPGRRWSEGLHQAVEAKERVRIENENQTLATITFQNYFRMYQKLAGMTGTAETEATEFAKIYNLDVLVIPTDKPMIRRDSSDMIYKTEAGKFRAVVKEIEGCHKGGQPVLVGTISIEKSERLSEMLSRMGIKHHVLNAKHHEEEAEIVAQAGRFGAVTISTNMAGRGTDIMLGGNPDFLAKSKVGKDAPGQDYKKVLEAFLDQCAREKEQVIAQGGLYIIGTERHEARRIDNQLRGRSGRQGDPGISRFYLSLEDDLLRIFGGERMSRVMERFGLQEDEEIQHPWLTRAIENAQKKVEAHNFSIRKNLLEYDDVMNLQRKTVYGRRREILNSPEAKDIVLDMIDQAVTQIVEGLVPEKLDPEGWNPQTLKDKAKQLFDLDWDLPQDMEGGRHLTGLDPREAQGYVGKLLYDFAVAAYESKQVKSGRPLFAQIEKFLLLSTLDSLWKEHLLQMDHLREGIGLRGYAQKDPLLEYKREGFALFRDMMERFGIDVVEKLFRVRIAEERVAQAGAGPARPTLPLGRPQAGWRPTQMSHQEISAFQAHPKGADPTGVGPTGVAAGVGGPYGTVRRQRPKVGRNDPCPCGSGKKYKKCCGA